MSTKKRKSRASKKKEEVVEEVVETTETLEEEVQPEQPQVEQAEPKTVKLVALQNWPLRDGRFAHKDALVEVSAEYAEVLLTQTRAFKLPSGGEDAQ